MQNNLIDKIESQFKKWLAFPIERPWPNNIWVEAKEGSIYVRYVMEWERLDLASFAIKPKYQRKGIALEVIKTALKQPVKVVRIESIGNLEWGEKIKRYQFDGFETKFISQGYDDLQYSIDFVRT